MSSPFCRRVDRFNPRPRARGDGKQHSEDPAVIVSIHAPARGATVTKPRIAGFGMFQSTPPREGRPVVGHGQTELCCCFNPRPRARGDTGLPR